MKTDHDLTQLEDKALDSNILVAYYKLGGKGTNGLKKHDLT